MVAKVVIKPIKFRIRNPKYGMSLHCRRDYQSRLTITKIPSDIVSVG
jgi:hypothetical protein